MTKQAGIYRIVCIENGKVYVGRAMNIQKRWGSHRWHLNKGTHRNSPLQADWTAMGASSFLFEVARTFPEGMAPEALDEELALAEHEELSRHFNAYNLMEAGLLSLTASEETRAKLSKLVTERWDDPDYRARLTESHKARHADPEFSAKRGASISIHNQKPESRAKKSVQFTKMWESPEHRADQSAKRTANWEDPAYRTKQSESRSGVWNDEAVRQKRIDGMKASWADPVKRAERQQKMLAGKARKKTERAAAAKQNAPQAEPKGRSKWSECLKV